jgi:hypothetical protein
VSVTQLDDWGALYISRLEVSDLDGDGDPEAFVFGGSADEGPDETWFELLTFKNGRIESYAPAKGIEIADVQDVDGDGRFDLLSPGPYNRVTQASALGGTFPAFGGALVMHTLPDGTFSATDAVAKDFLKKECPLQKPPLGPESTFNDILCARAWGASEADVMKALNARCKVWDEVRMNPAICLNGFKDAAAIAPPILLP